MDVWDSCVARYNTAIFGSLAANAYEYIVVEEAFLTPTAVFNYTGNVKSVSQPPLEIMHTKSQNNSLTRYESADCMTLYGTNFVSKARNVLLVTKDSNTSNNTALDFQGWSSSDQVPFAWICGDAYGFNPYTSSSAVCTLSKAKSTVSEWTVLGSKIEYCMVETVTEKCRLSFSLAIMIVVIIANMAKAVVMVLTYYKLREPTLVTIGDAVASFVDEPDEMTKGLCLVEKHDIETGKWKTQRKVGPLKFMPIKWEPKRQWWFAAASFKRWILCNFL